MAGRATIPSSSRGISPDGLTRASSDLTGASGSRPARAGGGLGLARVMDIQRARVLAAMVEVCGERGVGSVTVAHIVERAGVSRRTFYELYSDREDCFLAAFDDGVVRASRYVIEAYDPDARWVERVRLAIIGLLAFLDAEPGVGQLLVVGSLSAGRGVLQRRQRVLDRMIALVNEGRTEARAGAGLPPLTAEGVVGGVLSVLHARLLDYPSPSVAQGSRGEDRDGGSLLGLAGPLMGMIVLPYRGPSVARRESTRSVPTLAGRRPARSPADPLRDVQMRLTYRTVRVLAAVAELGEGGANPSNREIGIAAGINDQGQISKLLSRLARVGLIENSGAGLARGGPNAWTLTPKGREIEQAVGNGAVG
jgi:AcrR family transcriptional regulator